MPKGPENWNLLRHYARLPLKCACNSSHRSLPPVHDAIAAPDGFQKDEQAGRGRLALLSASTLLQLAEVTTNKNRFDAITAGQPTKSKRESGGKVKDANGAPTAKTKSERFV